MSDDAERERQEMIDALTDIADKFARGEIKTAALRVFCADGTHEDVVFGGDNEDKAAALANLHILLAKLSAGYAVPGKPSF